MVSCQTSGVTSSLPRRLCRGKPNFSVLDFSMSFRVVRRTHVECTGRCTIRYLGRDRKNACNSHVGLSLKDAPSQQCTHFALYRGRSNRIKNHLLLFLVIDEHWSRRVRAYLRQLDGPAYQVVAAAVRGRKIWTPLFKQYFKVLYWWEKTTTSFFKCSFEFKLALSNAGVNIPGDRSAWPCPRWSLHSHSPSSSPWGSCWSPTPWPPTWRDLTVSGGSPLTSGPPARKGQPSRTPRPLPGQHYCSWGKSYFYLRP